MFNLNALYTSNDEEDQRYMFYTACMNYIAGNADAGQLPAIKNLLGLQSLAFRNTGKSRLTRYLVAKDNTGYQLFMSQNVQWYEMWEGLTQEGTAVTPNVPGRPLTRVGQLAQAIVADFTTAFPNDGTFKVFVGGHGLAAAVATLIYVKLGAINYATSQVYGTACPPYANEDTILHLEPTDTRYIHYLYNRYDVLSAMPPHILWGGAELRQTHPPLEQLMMRGSASYFRTEARTRLSIQNVTTRITNAGRLGDWADCIQNNSSPGQWADDLLAPNNTITYIYGAWARLRLGLQDQLDEMFTIMNGTYTFHLTKKAS